MLALVLIYLVLSAQFESFVDPFIIMITVPLAMAGTVLSLWIFGQSLNIFSQIGIIMLIGLVTKNGILIVEFANQKRDKGIDKFNAAKEAAVARLRPILMTTLATTLGALPIALAIGSAGKSRIPLGIVIVGGLLFSLILTLHVVPSLYTYLSRKKEFSMNYKILGWLLLLPFCTHAQDSLLTEADVIKIALQGNLQIQIAKNDAQAATISNNWGFAGRWPTVTAGASDVQSSTNILQETSAGQTTKKNGRLQIRSTPTLPQAGVSTMAAWWLLQKQGWKSFKESVRSHCKVKSTASYSMY